MPDFNDVTRAAKAANALRRSTRSASAPSESSHKADADHAAHAGSDGAKKASPSGAPARSRLAGGVRNARPGAGASARQRPSASSKSAGSSSPDSQSSSGAAGNARHRSTRGGNQGAGRTPDAVKEPSKKGQAPNSDKKDTAMNADSDEKKSGSKLPGANATGVDYGDKGTKDRLEHQAADVAMDATPGVGQFNSARKALKSYNKAKHDARGDQKGENEDVADQLEHGADKVVDHGIKGAKIAVGTSMGSAAAGAAAIGLMLMKLFMMLKALVVGALTKIAGFFAGIFHAISSFASGVLGATAAIGNAIAAGTMAVTVALGSALGVGVVSQFNKSDDTIAACVPTTTAVSQASQEHVSDGQIDAMREANAVKVWSVYSALGGSKEQTAAVLGNLQAESSLDPTAMETIFDEPFQVGPKKAAAAVKGFKISLIDPSYAARFPSIQYVGIGLGQWTNGRNQLLVNYAKKTGSNWYDFDTQIKFMLDGDDSTRTKQLTSFLKATPTNVDSETEKFMNTWIGLSSPNSSLSARQTNAENYMFVLDRATADTSYADSILSGVNVNTAEGNNAIAAYQQDDGCGNKIASHYGNAAPDGTGEVPSGLTLVPWSRETLPDSLKKYSYNPEDAGLAWGKADGWAKGIEPDQCAALSHSYFMRLYPDWNKDGRPTTRPFGDGKDVAALWAKHYGQKTSDTPNAGAVFSDTTTSQYGHTGIVQHVFANGDILVNEQNIRGVSGAGAGISYSWSWRVIQKDRYTSNKWVFFKPADATPQWQNK